MKGVFSLLGAGVTMLATFALLDKEPAPEPLPASPLKEGEEYTTPKKKVRGKRKRK